MARWLCRVAATPGKVRPFSDSLGIFCPMPTARSKPHCDMWSVICQAQTHDECKVLLQVFPTKFNCFYSREDIPGCGSHRENGKYGSSAEHLPDEWRSGKRLPEVHKSSSTSTPIEFISYSGPLADAAMTPKWLHVSRSNMTMRTMQQNLGVACWMDPGITHSLQCFGSLGSMLCASNNLCMHKPEN